MRDCQCSGRSGTSWPQPTAGTGEPGRPRTSRPEAAGGRCRSRRPWPPRSPCGRLHRSPVHRGGLAEAPVPATTASPPATIARTPHRAWCEAGRARSRLAPPGGRDRPASTPRARAGGPVPSRRAKHPGCPRRSLRNQAWRALRARPMTDQQPCVSAAGRRRLARGGAVSVSGPAPARRGSRPGGPIGRGTASRRRRRRLAPLGSGCLAARTVRARLGRPRCSRSPRPGRRPARTAGTAR